MAGSSCQAWADAKGIRSRQQGPPPCPESLNANVDARELVQLMKCENVIKKYIDPDEKVRHRIDPANAFVNHGGKGFNISSAKKPIPCCMECRPRSAAVWAKQLTSLRRDKPPYKHAVRLDSATFVGRVFPMKFRLRRTACKCLNCNRELATHETVTDNDGMLLLSDCCTVEIHTPKQMENWNRVAVGTITGQKKFSKRTLTESCKQERKTVTLPAVVPTELTARKSKKRRATKYVKNDKPGRNSKKAKN